MNLEDKSRDELIDLINEMRSAIPTKAEMSAAASEAKKAADLIRSKMFQIKNDIEALREKNKALQVQIETNTAEIGTLTNVCLNLGVEYNEAYKKFNRLNDQMERAYGMRIKA